MSQSWMAFSFYAALMASAQLWAPSAAFATGEKATPVEPTEWLNHKGPISWKALNGRLILVEKWATT